MVVIFSSPCDGLAKRDVPQKRMIKQLVVTHKKGADSRFMTCVASVGWSEGRTQTSYCLLTGDRCGIIVVQHETRSVCPKSMLRLGSMDSCTSYSMPYGEK